MPSIEYMSTHSYMMRSIVSDCNCNERPVIVIEDGEYCVVCNNCHRRSGKFLRITSAIDDWTIGRLMVADDPKVLQQRMISNGYEHAKMSLAIALEANEDAEPE